MNIIHLIQKSYASKLPSLSPCCSTTAFYRLPPFRNEYEANESEKYLLPFSSSKASVSDLHVKNKASAFTAIAEDMLYKTRGPTEDPQKTSDRTCLRKFAIKTLETHDPKKAEEVLQEALAELGRLANDPRVNNPMAVFMIKAKNSEFGG